MKNICLGGSDFSLDLEKEGIHFILLAGESGSGKSIFHNNLYKQLSEKYSSEEVGFIFLDMTRMDFVGWSGDYLICPTEVNAEKSFKIIEELADGKIVSPEDKRRIFVQVEECDMVSDDRIRFENVLEKLKKMENVFLIYSTSRLDPGYIPDWIKRFFDAQVVFKVSNKSDLLTVGLSEEDYERFKLPGDRYFVWRGGKEFCRNFPVAEANELSDFKLE